MTSLLVIEQETKAGIKSKNRLGSALFILTKDYIFAQFDKS